MNRFERGFILFFSIGNLKKKMLFEDKVVTTTVVFKLKACGEGSKFKKKNGMCIFLNCKYNFYMQTLGNKLYDPNNLSLFMP